MDKGARVICVNLGSLKLLEVGDVINKLRRTRKGTDYGGRGFIRPNAKPQLVGINFK